MCFVSMLVQHASHTHALGIFCFWQVAIALAMVALLFQPIANQGMYSMDAVGKLNKGSFNNLEVPAMGERKTVPTLEAFFPFSK